MIRHIGFDGGHTIYELGPASDVELFFECLDFYVVRKHSDRDWTLLSDRLYRRYLRIDELDEAQALMDLAQHEFAGLPSSSVDWKQLPIDSNETWLNPDQPTLADVFAKYSQHFADARKSAESFFQAFHVYQPVRIVIADLPGFARDKKKPLTEYDALEGKPFWLQ
jgi:hypothetical protein